VERSPLVIDTGPLYAYVDADDADHHASLELLSTYQGALLAPVLAIAEVVQLLGRRLGPEGEIRFLAELATGTIHAEPVHAADWTRIAELVRRYGDFPLGTVDASVVAAAERLGVRRIATLDRRHFSAVRPAHVEAFELLP
jgi:predicted nucleic acid-binding protein